MADLTIDLGNQNTTVTFRELPGELARALSGVARERRTGRGLVVPSAMHAGREVLFGEEVVRRGLERDAATFWDLKDHVLHPRTVSRDVGGGRRVTYKEAAASFLSRLTGRLHDELPGDLNLALVCPTVGGESYRAWLRGVDLSAARTVTLVDEDTAVALGYGVNLFQDALLLVFDFGFSSLRARVLRFHWRGREAYTPPTVLAEVTLPTGTAELRRKARQEFAADAAGLPYAEDPLAERDRCRTLFERENVGAQVQLALDRVIEQSTLSGASKTEIRKVLLLGSGAALPFVRETLDANFGERVLELPLDSPAGLGGVDFLSDTQTDDRVRHAYSLMVRDPVAGRYEYPVVVERYTRYPTRQPTARFVVNVFYDGQYELHLQVFRTVRAGGAEEGQQEALFGEDGRVRFFAAHTDEAHEPAMETPLVIPVDPPGHIGERRFLLEFNVDGQKRLLSSVRDLKADKLLWDRKPVLELE